MARSVCQSAALLSLLLLFCRPAAADDSHYQDYIVGGRAMGLGGAYASLASDPSGVYYNPGGLVDVHGSNFQVSTSLYGFERGSIDPKALTLPVPGVDKLRVEFTELIIVPASAGFVRMLGDPLPDGRAKHAYALSVVVPSFRAFRATNPTDSGEPISDGVIAEQPPGYSRRVTDRSLWSGLGYAYRASDRLSFGISTYYVLRSVVDLEDVATSATIIDSDGIPENDQQVYRTARNDISFLNGSLVLGFGAKLKLTEELHAGLSFQTPSLRIHSQSTLRFTSGKSVPSCDAIPSLTPTEVANCNNHRLLSEPGSYLVTRSIDGYSETQHAPTLRAGISYASTYKYTASLDITHHRPVNYDLIMSRDLDTDLRARLPFNPHVERTAVTNINLGIEYLVVREVSIAAGFFTDFSSAPDIAATPADDQQPQVDLYGVTMALGYFGDHSLSRLGVLYSVGTGHDVIPTSNIDRVLDQQASFQRVSYFQSFFYLFVSSTFRY